jgi:hypothetical protein
MVFLQLMKVCEIVFWGLKIPRSQGHLGSIPSSGTNNKINGLASKSKGLRQDKLKSFFFCKVKIPTMFPLWDKNVAFFCFVFSV